MKLSRSRFLPMRALSLIAALAVFAAGCVTTDQIKTIVRDSNYQMLAASAPALGGLSADGTTDDSATNAAAQMNAFLAANQDDPVMTAALRLRQTLLYLSQQA